MALELVRVLELVDKLDHQILRMIKLEVMSFLRIVEVELRMMGVELKSFLQIVRIVELVEEAELKLEVVPSFLQMLDSCRYSNSYRMGLLLELVLCSLKFRLQMVLT